MNKRSILVVSAAIVLVVGVAVYGGIHLLAKMNQVKELNGQIAEASDNDDQGAEDKPGGGPEPEQTPVPADGDSDAGMPGREPAEGAEAPGRSPQPGNGAPDQATPGAVDPAGAESGAKPAASQPPATAPGQPAAGGGSSFGGGTPSGSNSEAEDKEQRKRAIDAAITADMEKLRSACSATSGNLVKQIVRELKSGGDDSLQKIQDQYLADIVAAEADCDARFAGLVGEAQKQYAAAGLNAQSLPDWSAEYESAKEQARSNALAEIASAMQ